METHNDIAIPISWPDMTAFGDEKWMAALKKIGIIKNLNFKVGHAAILLVERSSGHISYFDFGRYLCPRGHGRARSADFDKRLIIQTKAVYDDKDIINLKEILEELCAKENATHGGGRMLFSIAENISYTKGVSYANSVVEQGPILYGALANNNNSCSRYVAQILTKAMKMKDKRINKILYPEFIKASPTSNVVNASLRENIYCYHKNELEEWSLGRWASLKFQISLLKDNFRSKDVTKLKDDSQPGLIAEPQRPPSIPKTAQWIGGIGEGAWFHIVPVGGPLYEIFKFDVLGQVEHAVLTHCTQRFEIGEPYSFTYNFGHNFYSIRQNDNLCLFRSDEYTGTANHTHTEITYRKII